MFLLRTVILISFLRVVAKHGLVSCKVYNRFWSLKFVDRAQNIMTNVTLEVVFYYELVLSFNGVPTLMDAAYIRRYVFVIWV